MTTHANQLRELTLTLIGCKSRHAVEISSEWTDSLYAFIKRPSPTAISALVEDARALLAQRRFAPVN